MGISGITVTLFERQELRKDLTGAPVYEETAVDVENVLVAPSSSDDIVDGERLYGKKAVYTIGIPKGDTHQWEGCRVDFLGQSWRVFGFVTMGIEANIPLSWNAKAMVEKYG